MSDEGKVIEPKTYEEFLKLSPKQKLAFIKRQDKRRKEAQDDGK